MGDFVRIMEHGDSFIGLIVHMTNGKTRVVAVDHLWAALLDYRTAFGLVPEPTPGESTPLILSPFKQASPWPANSGDPDFRQSYKFVTSRQGLYVLIRHAFDLACVRLANMGKTSEANLVSKASTSWLQRTYATTLGEQGASLVTIADNLGWSDINTPRRYINVDFATRAAPANEIDMP